jgi:hypothetical protein
MSDDNGMASTLEYILSDVCGFLLLRPFMSGLERAMFIHCGELSGTFDQGLESLSRVIKRGGRGTQVVKFHLPVLIIARVEM